MEKAGWAIWLFAVLAFWPMGSTIGAEADKIPAIELPDTLKLYSDESRVLEAAEGVIRLLGAARFKEPEADSPFAKEPCNAPDIVSFYRGMTLMQAGYFIFISKVERGFESTDSPHVALGANRTLVPANFGVLVRPGRELLVAVWDKDRLTRLLSLISEFRSLPPTVKGDLATYFRTLQKFGWRYDALKRRAPLELAKLNERSTELYSYERRDKLDEARRQGERELRIAEVEYPERVFYETYAKEMRLLLNANRDIEQATVSECMDGGRFAAVQIGEMGEITYSPYGLYPASYMVGFWQRRGAEGTTLLVRFAIDRLLSELERPN